jgi:flagellar biosynthesis/type III secretory pathway chaperone
MEVNMEDEVLSTKIVEPLLRITESNYRLFKELCDFEQNGMKNSNEYKKMLDYLSMVKEEEEELYSSISKDISLCRDAAFYIVNHKLPNKDCFINLNIILNITRVNLRILAPIHLEFDP